MTDGIVLRGGLHQPDTPLPRPEDESSRGTLLDPGFSFALGMAMITMARTTKGFFF